MQPFLRKLALFLLPIIALLIATEVLLRAIPNDYSFKHERLQVLSKELKILALGTSSGYRDFDPKQLNCHAFNGANISQHLIHDQAILGQHINQFDSLKWVVVFVPYGCLRTDPDSSLEHWRAKNYVLYHSLPQFGHEPEHFMELLNRPFQDQVSMVYRYHILNKDNRSCDSLGMGLDKPVLPPDEMARDAETAALRHTSATSYRVPVNTGSLISMIQMCRSRKIHVALVTPPCHPFYRMHTDPSQYSELTSTMKDLARIFDNVLYLDYFEDSRFALEDYADGCHLNPAGAARFTRELSQHLPCK